MDNYDLEVFQLKDKTKYLLKFNNTKALVAISSALNVFSDKYFFNPKYKMGIWDGKISFIKNDKIPVGLLSRVLTVCKNMQLQAKIHFKNPLVSISNNENDNVDNQNTTEVEENPEQTEPEESTEETEESDENTEDKDTEEDLEDEPTDTDKFVATLNKVEGVH